MANRKKRVSMQTIADTLGISKYAVSLALDNKPGVSEALRTKVFQTAQDMGYTRRKQSFINKQGSILILIPEYIKDDIFFYSEIYWAIESEIQAQGYTPVIISISKANEQQAQLPTIFSESTIVGFITVGVFSLPYLQKLINTRFPFVSVDQYYDTVNVDSVNTANEEGGYQMTKYLIDQGHRDIGFIGETITTSSNFARWCGYVKAMQDHQLPIPQEHCILSGSTLSSLFKDSSEFAPVLMRMPSYPTAWFCANDGSAVSLINYLQSKGLNVPNDISVVGFDDQKISSIVAPALTTYHVHRTEMGCTAVKLLLNRIAQPSLTKTKLSIMGEVIVRNSVKAISV